MATIETISKWNREWLETLQFVVSATAGKKESREMLKCIKVERIGEKVWAYGADGYRLHIADITEFPPISEGMYTAIKNTKTELILQREEAIEESLVAHPYPDVWSIIPDSPKVLDCIGYSFVWAYAKIIRTMTKDIINPEYIKDLHTEDHAWSMWYGGSHSAIGFKNERLCACIMPMYGDNG